MAVRRDFNFSRDLLTLSLVKKNLNSHQATTQEQEGREEGILGSNLLFIYRLLIFLHVNVNLLKLMSKIKYLF